MLVLEVASLTAKQELSFLQAKYQLVSAGQGKVRSAAKSETSAAEHTCWKSEKMVS